MGWIVQMTEIWSLTDDNLCQHSHDKREVETRVIYKTVVQTQVHIFLFHKNKIFGDSLL